MLDFFSVENIALNILGYPLSWIELIATVFYFWATILCLRRNIWSWPVGIVSNVLLLVLFYQISLYSDTLEQFYWIAASLYGWYIWHKSPKNPSDKAQIEGVFYSKLHQIFIVMGVTFVGSLVLNEAISRIHLWLPSIFPVPASYPYVDSLTTIMSFVAGILLAQKRIENWAYWIAIDIIGFVLYSIKDVKFLALQFLFLTFIAIAGWLQWHKASKKTVKTI